MNQDNVINVLCLLQLISFIIIYLESEKIIANYKLEPLKVWVARAFMMFLPSITLLSILIKPLEG